MIVALAVLYIGGPDADRRGARPRGVGLVGFGLVPSLQYRVVAWPDLAGGLAATLPASAVTLGIAIGSLVGGWGTGRTRRQGFGHRRPDHLRGRPAGLVLTGLLKPPVAEPDVVVSVTEAMSTRR